jgi:DNA polymerase delta subunit 2
MERTLQWRHLAPTAPDTLSAFPFKTGDPFVLEQCPHIYFVGNQDNYESRLAKGQDGQIVRLISIPEYSKSKTFVLVNLDTLNCHPITIETYSDDVVE